VRQPVAVHRLDITPEVVRRLVREQAPQWADLPVRPVEREGWDNRTYRLGDELSVRLPSHEMYGPQVEKEHRWLPVLAPQLDLSVPEPVLLGEPSAAFPRPWSVYRWLPGRAIDAAAHPDRLTLAHDLARFLTVLHGIDASDGPTAGRHSFGRGSPVDGFDEETRAAIARFGPAAALDVWEAALDAPFDGPAVWVHGDVTGSNLLATDGRLSAVIDFGCSAVGDPACDLVMAWTSFTGAERSAFVAGVDVDAGTWARARGWALWKAVITRWRCDGDEPKAARSATRFGWRLDPAEVVDEIVASATDR
jgi:aminoglycoside phosphotransferase (APT) family kinase protein